MNKNYFIIGLIILALVVIGVIASRPGEEIVVDNNGNDSGQTTSQPFVEVQSQTVNDSRIAIDRAFSESDGWLVIHRTDNDGNPDTSSYVGYTRLIPGENTGVIMTLDEEVSNGEILVAMLYVDAGNVGEFEIDGDEPVDVPVIVNGQVVSELFTIITENEALETEEDMTEESTEETESETEGAATE